MFAVGTGRASLGEVLLGERMVSQLEGSEELHESIRLIEQTSILWENPESGGMRHDPHVRLLVLRNLRYHEFLSPTL